MSDAPPAPEPIVLVEPSSVYKQHFEEERLRIAIGLGRLVGAIEHVGSTAIPGIKTKPIVDMLIGRRELPLEAMIEPLVALGYEYREGAGGAERLFFKRTGPRSFHAHVVLFDGPEWRRHVIFRDWLNLRADWAKDYETLKVDLAARFANNRDLYTEGKNDFVARALAEAAKFPALRLKR